MSNGEAKQGAVSSRLSLIEQAQEVSKRLDEASDHLYRLMNEIERVSGRREVRDIQIKNVSVSPPAFNPPIAAVTPVEDPLHVIAAQIRRAQEELASGPQPISVATAIRILAAVVQSLTAPREKLDVQA